MRRRNIGLIIAGIALLIAIIAVIGSYNNLVEMDEEVKTALSQIDNQLQRRNDLIPNLVETVKGYATQEKEIFTEIANARAKLAGADTLAEKAAASAEVSQVLSRLLVITENYPQLKSDENFKSLSDELAGTENRIAQARRDYNNKAKEFNTKIRRFPTSLVASIFNFEKYEYFEASEQSKEVPKVQF